ncbi:hypothetical protein BpHYR1_029286 [Brachionus plicatilis]|uniref:Uncharacterized protein n=1 Tax=Brachionus plicatilis TaxID=10195 RepID=A0A3M7PPL3_BRAPC|nr:hypothetical protein BpHYR1_029286 [Brachionus plicatilis]
MSEIYIDIILFIFHMSNSFDFKYSLFRYNFLVVFGMLIMQVCWDEKWDSNSNSQSQLAVVLPTKPPPNC